MNEEHSPIHALIAQIAEEVTRAACREIAAQAPAIMREALKEPPHVPRGVEEDRLLSLDEVAARLGCTKQRVTQRMARGEIIWTVEAGKADRKVKKSRLDAYIAGLPEYAGRKSEATPAANIC